MLQHIGDVEAAVGELRPRHDVQVAACSPSSPTTARATGIPRRRRASRRSRHRREFFRRARRGARGRESTLPWVRGFPALFARHGIEPLNVTPVSRCHSRAWVRRPPRCLDTPPGGRSSRPSQQAPAEPVRPLGREYLEVLAAYASRSRATAGSRLRRNPEHDAVCDRWPENVAKGTRAGTSTRRSTTGRTRARSAGATSHSGGTVAARRGRHGARARVAAPAASRCRWDVPACSLVGIDRSGRDAGTRAPARGARARLNGRVSSRPGRYPCAAVSGGSLLAGDRALRRASVAASRTRSGRHAARGARRAPAWWHVRRRAGGRPAVVGRVPAAREPQRLEDAARGGAHVTLVETVRQDRARHLTIFDQEFTERTGRASRIRAVSR